MLNTELGSLNDSSLILKNDRYPMYNAIYVFLIFTCPICKKTKTYILLKTKAFGLAQLKKAFRCPQ